MRTSGAFHVLLELGHVDAHLLGDRHGALAIDPATALQNLHVIGEHLVALELLADRKGDAAGLDGIGTEDGEIL